MCGCTEREFFPSQLRGLLDKDSAHNSALFALYVSETVQYITFFGHSFERYLQIVKFHVGNSFLEMFS